MCRPGLEDTHGMSDLRFVICACFAVMAGVFGAGIAAIVLFKVWALLIAALY